MKKGLSKIIDSNNEILSNKSSTEEEIKEAKYIINYLTNKYELN